MNENISRLMDGDLDDATFESVCHALKQGDAMATWVCYHVISDGLRGAAPLSPGFSARFATALAAEPTVLAPNLTTAATTAVLGADTARARPRQAATVAWAMAASIAAAAVVGWTAFSMVEAPPTAVARARDATSLRAAFVKPATQVPSDYLLAHAEYSPAATVAALPPAFISTSAP